MQTCTLLVRLAGLWLFGKSWIVLHTIFQAKSMMESMGGTKAAMGYNMGYQQILINQDYATAGLLIGVGAIIFAGPLARLLTFDTKPSRKSLLD